MSAKSNDFVGDQIDIDQITNVSGRSALIDTTQPLLPDRARPRGPSSLSNKSDRQERAREDARGPAEEVEW